MNVEEKRFSPSRARQAAPLHAFTKEIAAMRTILVFTMLTVLGLLEGCGGNRELIKAMSASSNQRVFEEIEEKASPIPGYADLHIYSSLKTHKPGIHAERDAHGTQDYMLLVNIDGQSVKIPGCLNAVRSAMCDSEQGEGVSYQFKTRLRIKAGAHKVVVALPADDLVAEREVIIADGENTLTVEPIYGSIPGKKRPGTFGRQTSFKQGINSIRLLLNGKNL
jgi:hypothetical protein